MVSYPLYGDNARSDRVAALREVNADAARLFHSGSRDEYLDRRGWRGLAKLGSNGIVPALR